MKESRPIVLMRTMWRPGLCIGAAISLLCYPATLLADAWGLIEWLKGEPLSQIQISALHTAAALIAPFTFAAMGLREWGKTRGNK